MTRIIVALACAPLAAACLWASLRHLDAQLPSYPEWEVPAERLPLTYEMVLQGTNTISVAVQNTRAVLTVRNQTQTYHLDLVQQPTTYLLMQNSLATAFFSMIVSLLTIEISRELHHDEFEASAPGIHWVIPISICFPPCTTITLLLLAGANGCEWAAAAVASLTCGVQATVLYQHACSSPEPLAYLLRLEDPSPEEGGPEAALLRDTVL
jgi:hypothetical protein